MDGVRKQQFEKAYDEYADSIFRYLLIKTHDRQLAIDLTHDTYVRTWDYLAGGTAIREMRPFLYRVAYNLWCNEVRKLTRQTSLDALVDQGWQPADKHDIEEEAAERELQSQLLNRIDRLDDVYKEVLLLRYVDDLSIKEIAGMLEETENAISVRLHRARQQLKTIYEDNA